MKRVALLLSMIVLAGCALSRRTGAPAREAAELAAVAQAFFDAVAMRDSAAIRALFTPNARIIAIWDDSGSPAYDDLGVAGFASEIATGDGPLIARMWNPEVRVSGRLATLWTRYDLHRRWEFSHCGVDAFQMVRVDGGWRITALSFTGQTEDCPPAPPR
jgi:Domain of unknown function (DUF4440)